MSLDEAQAVVAGHDQGAVLVNAGPGTGKTRCLSARFVNLVESGVAAPPDILAVTFTREAASVMKERVQEGLGEDVEGLRISTIHSLAYSLLRLGNKKPKVAPPEDAYERFVRAFHEVGMTERQAKPETLFHLVAGLKERLISPEQYKDKMAADSLSQESVYRVYDRYQDLLAEENLVDFGDLVMGAVAMIQGDEDMAGYLRTLTPYIMVDEFQDTSPAQYALLRALSPADRNNLMAVGSPAQTIHEWRGARLGELLDAFHRDFPQAPSYTLRYNYRSTQRIVSAAAAVGEGYPDAEQEARRPVGDPIEVWRPANQFEEAGRVALTAQRWIEEGIAPDDIAVLYRTHRQADPLEAQLTAQNIPYQMTGALRLYDHLDVQVILAYLGLALNPVQDGLLELVVNTPPRGLGPNSVARIRGSDPVLTLAGLWEAAQNAALPTRVKDAAQELLSLLERLERKARSFPPRRMVQAVLSETKYQEWLDGQLDGYRRSRALAQLVQDAERFDDLSAFLKYAKERTEQDQHGVHLSTIHASKGREWRAVIVISVVEGLLPHSAALKQGGEPEEERRLLYVAMTRAKDRLVLSVPRTLTTPDGDVQEATPSRFLRRLPREAVRIIQ